MSLHGCLLALLSSNSLAQNDCGHMSNMWADHVRRGKGWMLSIDAVAVTDGENPLSAHPDQGSPSFSLTKPVRLPSSIAHCRDVGSCLLPPPSSAAWSTWSRNSFHRTWIVCGEADSWVHGRIKEVPPYYMENNDSST